MYKTSACSARPLRARTSRTSDMLKVSWVSTDNYTEQNYKHNTFVFAPISTQRSETFSMYTNGLLISNIVHKCV